MHAQKSEYAIYSEFIKYLKRGEGSMFHTRRKTYGKINDENTQPIETNQFVIAHNGNCRRILNLRGKFGLRMYSSDTRVIAEYIERNGIAKFYENYSNFGVLLIYDKFHDKVYLLKDGGHFEAIETKYGLLYCSSFGPFFSRGGSKTFFKAITINRFIIKDGNYELSSDGFYPIFTKKQR